MRFILILSAIVALFAAQGNATLADSSSSATATSGTAGLNGSAAAASTSASTSSLTIGGTQELESEAAKNARLDATTAAYYAHSKGGVQAVVVGSDANGNAAANGIITAYAIEENQ